MLDGNSLLIGRPRIRFGVENTYINWVFLLELLTC